MTTSPYASLSPTCSRSSASAPRRSPRRRSFWHPITVGQTRCLILDVAMPGMTGPELQRELVRRGQSIPTIFITALKDDTVRPRLIEQGAVDCLFKPFTDDALQEALSSALRPELSVAA